MNKTDNKKIVNGIIKNLENSNNYINMGAIRNYHVRDSIFNNYISAADAYLIERKLLDAQNAYGLAIERLNKLTRANLRNIKSRLNKSITLAKNVKEELENSNKNEIKKDYKLEV